MDVRAPRESVAPTGSDVAGNLGSRAQGLGLGRHSRQGRLPQKLSAH